MTRQAQQTPATPWPLFRGPRSPRRPSCRGRTGRPCSRSSRRSRRPGRARPAGPGCAGSTPLSTTATTTGREAPGTSAQAAGAPTWRRLHCCDQSGSFGRTVAGGDGLRSHGVGCGGDGRLARGAVLRRLGRRRGAAAAGSGAATGVRSGARRPARDAWGTCRLRVRDRVAARGPRVVSQAFAPGALAASAVTRATQRIAPKAELRLTQCSIGTPARSLEGLLPKRSRPRAAQTALASRLGSYCTDSRETSLPAALYPSTVRTHFAQLVGAGQPQR